MAQYSSPLPDLTQAAKQTDDLVSQLTSAITGLVGALQRAGSLNPGFASAQVWIQYALQAAEAVRKLAVEGSDQAKLYRTTVADISTAEANRSGYLTDAGKAIPGASPQQVV